MATTPFNARHGLSVNGQMTVSAANGQTTIGSVVANTTSISVGANVVANTTAILVGNSTVNSTLTPTYYNVTNSTSTTNVVPGQVSVGANAYLSSSTMFIGNSTVNTSVNSSVVYSGSYNTASDKRLKKNIKKAPSGALNLDPKQFVYKTDPTRIRYGFIAQDVKQHFPELVTEHSDGKLSLNYNDIIALLVKEVKDLTARVEQLERSNV
jgi:uncharacterized protein affecting Mg2+/Co2+ transport